MNPTRRALLAGFLAAPVALRFRPWKPPAVSDLAAAGYFLFMSPMTPGQLQYDELDIAMGLAPSKLGPEYSATAREKFARLKSRRVTWGQA